VTWNGHGDALAVHRINADGTLTLANSYTYSTWGTPTPTAAPGSTDLGFRFLYVGAYGVQWDDFSGLGLEYMAARHYSPRIGRFLQPDPSALEANLYGYAAENPVTYLDPNGTFVIALCLTPIGAPICVKVGAETAAGVVAAGFFLANVLVNVRGDTPRATLRGLGRAWTVTGVQSLWRGLRDIIIRAQKEKNQLDSLRQARREVLRRLDQPGNERAENHWQRQLNGQNRRILDILRRHPHWRRSGDPR